MHGRIKGKLLQVKILKNQNPTLVKVENSKLHSAAGTLASVAKS